MRPIAAALALVCLPLSTPAAASIRAADSRWLADALTMPLATSLIGAPDAPVFAWVVNRAGARNLWAGGTGRPARALTAFDADDGMDIYDLSLSRDGRLIAFVRGGDAEFPSSTPPNPAGQAHPPQQQVFVIDSDSHGAPRSLGEGYAPAISPDGRRVAFVRRGTLYLADSSGKGSVVTLADMPGLLGTPQWSPDGTRLLMVDQRGDHGLIALVDVAGGSVRFLDPDFKHDSDPIFSPDGRQVAFIRVTTPPLDAPANGAPLWSLRVVDLASGTARTAWQPLRGEGARWSGTRSRNLFWSADGRLIFPWERTGWRHVYAVPAAGGTAVELTPGSGEVESFLLSDNRRTLIYAGNFADRERRHLWRRDLAGGSPEAITRGTGIESAPAIADGTLAAIETGPRQPAEPVIVGAAGTFEPMGVRPDDFAPAAQFVAPVAVAFRSGDGMELHADFFAARGDRRTKHPALVFIHGGPRRQMLLGFHPMGYYSNAYLLNQHFAEEGYDVLAVNYRTGTGYGEAFRDAPDTGAAGAAEYRDIVAAGRWLAARPDVDPARIGLWGGSWGGYLTALGLARDSDMFAAGVDMHGVHDRITAAPVLTAMPAGLSPRATEAWRETAWASSPLAAIATWRSPVLLVHGDDDKNVDFSQSVELDAELTARGVPHENLVLPNERHEFLRYASWLRAYQAADDFLARQLHPDR